MKSNLFPLVTWGILFFIPQMGFAQAPNLGMSSDFAVFTSVGAFDNLGASSIMGDVGTDVGAFTGFPPGAFTGSSHIADPTSTQTAIDVDVAYSFLVGVPCDTAIAVSLGGGQILGPKVYCLGAASTLTGNLILDGQGSPNAIFIFKIDGAFSTSTFSNIVLVDSAVSCNVYWQINGAFILGDNSVFQGTVINNGAISLLEASSVFGRVLSRQGAIDLHNNDVNNICSSNPPLPIELISFNASCNNQNVDLKWSTSSETNNDYFSIEHCSDAINWEVAGIVDGMGISNILVNYSFTDINPHDNDSYYRLKQTDFDGNFKYYSLISLENCGGTLNAVNIYPNPTNGVFSLLLEESKSEVQSISIYNTLGMNIYHSFNYQPIIDLSNQKNGIYFLHVNLPSGTIIKKLIIKK